MSPIGPARVPASATLQRVLAAVIVAGGLACHRIVDGTDPEPLGYGPGPSAELAVGYDRDPVPRPRPTAWEPPDRRPLQTLGKLGKLGEPGAPEAVPPSKDVVRVCQHVVALADPGEPVAPEDCLRQYQIEQVFRTLPSWKTFASCVEAAAEPAALDDCARATPRAFVEIEAYPLESQVCLHLFALTIVEELGPDPQLEAAALAEFEEVLRGCVTSFVEDERSARSPGEYLELLACIDQATTSGDAEGCD